MKREALGHAAYARSRERVHIGRPEYFARLDAHAAADDDQPLVILGESGSGKSALLANWAARYRHAHPEALVLEHYIGASPPASADWAAMLRRILGEFKRQLGLTQDIPKQLDALPGAFANWLHMAAAKGRIVLILDSLNQLEQRDGAAELLWLPRLMPEKLRLIVSTLPGKSLAAITERHWPTLTVEPLLLGERQQLICLFLRDYGRRLSPARVERIAGAPQSANPLYLRVLLNELRLFGQHEHLEERIAYYLQAASPSELYGMVIARWEENYGAGTSLVCDTLSLLWAARYGLSESELLDALGQNGERLPHAVWSPLSLAMADALVSRSALLSFTHDFLRTAARETYLPRESDQQEAHLHLADYFERQPAGARRTDELPWHLAEAGAWRRLYDLLVDRSFLTVAWERNEFDVKTYWTKIEAGSALRVVDAFREQVEHPESEGNKAHLWLCSRLLADTGHPHEALRLSAALVEYSRANGDLRGLQLSLGAQASILFALGSLDEAMALVQEQDQLCQRLGDLTGVQLARGGQAIVLYAQGDLDGALVLHAAAERFWRGVGNLHQLQASLNNRAVILYKRGDLGEAQTLYKEQEQICLQLGDLRGQVISLGNQAPILQDCGDVEGALTLLAKAEEICRRLGDLPQLQVILSNRAVALYKRGKFGESMATLEEEDRLSRQLGDLKALSSSLAQQALILHAYGDLDGALALHKKQGRISKQLGDLDGLQTSLGNQALILQDRGDLDGAMALHREEERICRQLGNLKGLQESRGHQAAILHARGDLAGAMALLKEKEQICQQLGNLQGLSSSLGNQGLIWKDRGNLDKALALHKRQEQLCRQIGHLDGLSHSLGSQALILMECGDLDAAMALHRQEEQISRQLGSLKGLSRSLGNQANVLFRRGDLDAAMELRKQQEGLLRQLGDMHGVVLCLINQSLILDGIGSVGQALPLAEDAYQLANRYGYGRLVREIEPIAQRMRQACDGYG